MIRIRSQKWCGVNLSLGVEHWKVRTDRKAAEPIKLRILETKTWQLGYGGEAPLAKRETAQISK